MYSGEMNLLFPTPDTEDQKQIWSPGKIRKTLEMQIYAMLQADRMQMQMPSIEGKRSAM